MNSIEIKPDSRQPDIDQSGENKSLGSAVLLYNAIWFTKVRWIIIILFLTVGMTGHTCPVLFSSFRLVAPGRWIIYLAAILTAANIYFQIHSKTLNGDSSSSSVKDHLWTQIITDLLVLTVVVYNVGSIETFICFTYLLHIVLACIFFNPAQSFLVTVLASALFFTITTLEATNIIPRTSMLIGDHFVVQPDFWFYMMYTFSAILVWVIVWYLVSTLSHSVRTRDIQLAKVNQELIEADREKNKKVLRTTHDLKAPFSGMENNIEILRSKYWDSMPEPARVIIDRIQVRAQTLSERIKEILVLGDLRSGNNIHQTAEIIEIEQLINAVMEELKARADKRRVTVKRDIPAVSITTDRKKLFFLFANIITNAITYSREGGTVTISGRKEEDALKISIADEGIGISESALPHIFDEYFRSIEGASFNKQSSGLGLAIVKEIAESLKLGIKVSSEQNKGTIFEITLPVSAAQTPESES